MAALSLKNKQRSIALVSLLFCSSALAATLEQPIGESHVRIINSLEQCVSFGLPVWGEIDSVPLLTIKANLMNSIADCGCKSALAGYTLLEGQGAESRVLYSGKFSMLASGIKSLQLGTKGSSKTENVPLTLAVGCAQPD